ncbi:MAG: hypothetical protein IRY97_02770 [Thermomicrobiaceae bacterium]|nr:hypothetical protein [Thermomicrobiaceae bacterium]
MGQRSADAINEITEYLRPFIAPLIERIDVDEFTTVEFIEAMQLDPPTREAYRTALRRWPEPDEHLAKMVVHGQVIPLLLRESGLVEWAGYAHGEEDPYAVPAWWRKRSAAEAE